MASNIDRSIHKMVRCRKNANLRPLFPFSSSQRIRINIHKNIQGYLILVIYCLLSNSCRNGSVLQRPKSQMVAFAFVPAPTTKQPGRKRSNGIRNRKHSSKSTTTKISTLDSNIAGEKDSDNNNSNESGDDIEGWRSNLPRDGYASPLLWERPAEWKIFLKQFQHSDGDEISNVHTSMGDHLWEQVKLEALTQLSTEPEAGPQLYQSILSQGSLVEAIVSIIAST